jgi:prepilin-type N-terminal cleavage/methylation domain-containing protein
MRKGFTLIELMIVIAIIAIIAAIAVPNLLESRITANEAAAATTLKSGLFPGQVQFAAGGYIDTDSDGVGVYANNHRAMAGTTGAANSLVDDNAAACPASALNLMGSDYNQAENQAVNGYQYELMTAATENAAERNWIAVTLPETFGDTGRRGFAIAQTGSVLASSATWSTATNLVIANFDDATSAQAMTIYVTDPLSASSGPLTSNFVPYRK